MGHNYTSGKTVVKCTQKFTEKCLEKQPLGRPRKGLDNSEIGPKQTSYEDGRYKEDSNCVHWWVLILQVLNFQVQVKWPAVAAAAAAAAAAVLSLLQNTAQNV